MLDVRIHGPLIEKRIASTTIKHQISLKKSLIIVPINSVIANNKKL